jgi:5-methylcytosine-specific restriction endonuclease McrA
MIVNTNHVCERCGTPYYRKRQTRFTSRFCSRACMYAQFKGEGNPNYRHGQNQAAARAMLYGNEKRCAVCQWDVHVHAHHIVPKRSGGQNGIDNLIFLCPNHHWMADHGLLAPDHLQRLALWSSSAPDREG